MCTSANQLFSDEFWASFSAQGSDKDKKSSNKSSGSSQSRTMVLKGLFEKSAQIPLAQIGACIASDYASKDITKAFELVRYFSLTEAGLLTAASRFDRMGNPITLVGAQNWGNVMCYLDLLLFAMFAKLESFEPLLLPRENEEPKLKRLRALLRLYVSLVRLGQLVTLDVTRLLCVLLLENGFLEALSRKQEDSCQLFIFLTEILQMPLLTLKIDIAHGGQYEKDDHRYTKERMLYVSIPEEDIPKIEEEGDTKEESKEASKQSPQEKKEEEAKNGDKKEKEGKEEPNSGDSKGDLPVETEDNSKESEGKQGIADDKSKQSVKTDSKSQLKAESGNDPKKGPVESEIANPTPKPTGQSSILLEECLEHYFNNSVQVRRQLERRRSLRRPTIEEKSRLEHIENPETLPEELGTVTYSETASRPRASSIVKENYQISSRSRANSTVSIFLENKAGEVSLPAWMFLQLLPFYTDLGPDSPTERSFAQKRPILPICLKRYTFDKSSRKSHKRVIIPPFIDLPNFIADEEHGRYRLVLESVVCHRGTSIDSGHFVAIVRDEPPDLSSTEEEEENRTWLVFDDLADSGRVKKTTFKEAFSKESPYVLFFRMVEVEEDKEALSCSLLLERKLSDSVVLKEGGDKKSHDLLSKVVFSGSTYPYPNSSEYVDIRERFYWKTGTLDGYFAEASMSLLGSKTHSKRNSLDMSLMKSLYSEEESALGLSVENLEEDVHKVKRKSDVSSKSSIWTRKLSLRRRSKAGSLEGEKIISILPSSREADEGEPVVSLSVEGESGENEATEVVGTPEEGENIPEPAAGLKPPQEGFLSPTLSFQSPRSSFEAIRYHRLKLSEHSAKSDSSVQKLLQDSKSSLWHKRMHQDKVRRERYKKEKCVVM